MAQVREDAAGLWWTAIPTTPVRASSGQPKTPKERKERQAQITFDPSSLPAPPQTGWEMPTEFPSLEAAEVICIDCETDDPGLRAGKGPGIRVGGEILGVAVATDYGFNKYYPIAHAGTQNLEKETVFGWLSQEVGRVKQVKLGANILYDLDFLAEQGVWVKGPIEDVQIAEPLLDENAMSYSLDVLAKKYTGEGKLNSMLSDWGDKYFGKGKTKSYMKYLPAYFVGPYAEQDTALTLETWRRQRKRIEAEGLQDIYSIECRLIPMLLYMRRKGVRADVLKTEELADRLDKEAVERQAWVNKEVGYPVDIWAAESMEKVFKQYQIPMQFTATGKPSFTKGYLEKQEHPVIKSLLRLRKLEKLNGTFIKGHILGNAINGRIHCEFNQLRRTSDQDLEGTVTNSVGAVSGRFSSSNPNLQNIPIRDPDFGKLIRGCFIPDEDGEKWVKADYAQIEPRILLHYSDRAGALVREGLNTNPEWSPYNAIAKDMPAGIEYKTVKNIYLGLTYNMGMPKLAASLGLPIQEAQELFNLFHEGAPYVGNLKKRVVSKVDKTGRLKTLLGRTRHFDMWETRDFERAKKEGAFPLEEALERYGNGKIRRAWTFKSLNALIQGSAADVQKKAMVDLWESGVAEAAKLCLTVHDEMDGSVPDENSELIKEIKYTMERAVKLRVPVIADMGVGNNWGECD